MWAKNRNCVLCSIRQLSFYWNWHQRKVITDILCKLLLYTFLLRQTSSPKSMFHFCRSFLELLNKCSFLKIRFFYQFSINFSWFFNHIGIFLAVKYSFSLFFYSKLTSVTSRWIQTLSLLPTTSYSIYPLRTTRIWRATEAIFLYAQFLSPLRKGIIFMCRSLPATWSALLPTQTRLSVCRSGSSEYL